jgi:hypothetical protein
MVKVRYQMIIHLYSPRIKIKNQTITKVIVKILEMRIKRKKSKIIIMKKLKKKKWRIRKILMHKNLEIPSKCICDNLLIIYCNHKTMGLRNSDPG